MYIYFVGVKRKAKKTRKHETVKDSELEQKREIEWWEERRRGQRGENCAWEATGLKCPGFGCVMCDPGPFLFLSPASLNS